MTLPEWVELKLANAKPALMSASSGVSAIWGNTNVQTSEAHGGHCHVITDVECESVIEGSDEYWKGCSVGVATQRECPSHDNFQKIKVIKPHGRAQLCYITYTPTLISTSVHPKSKAQWIEELELSSQRPSSLPPTTVTAHGIAKPAWMSNTRKNAEAVKTKLASPCAVDIYRIIPWRS